ncbi:MAG TPA: FAD binding domain-containing protein [Planctomycetota bacterium]|nr:FAD binding domain-containing protein [Planctomycetota bacterium]
MKPFEIVRAEGIAATSKAAGATPGAVFKAAGIDLLDRMKERQFQPPALVDLLRLRSELAAVKVEPDGGIAIGALVTLAGLAAAPELADPAFAGLREAAGIAATPQIRSRATVAGNLLQQARCWYLRSAAFPCAHKGGETCFAMYGENRYHSVLAYDDCVRVHPSNIAPPLLTLGAEVTVQRGDAVRRIKLAELWPERPTAAAPDHTLAPDEIVTWIHLPKPAAGSRGAYCESREKLSFDWATTAAAAFATLADGKVVDARLCLGAVAPGPVPVPAATEMLAGKVPTAALCDEVAAAAFAGAKPLYHNAYKVPTGTAIAARALRLAFGIED